MNYNREIQWLFQEKYKRKESSQFLTDVRRLKRGEPIAYVIGSIPFLGCTIHLSMRPFIPRPETEYWVEKAIKKITQSRGNDPIHCLDLFSGSGCIGIALLKHLPNAQVDFAEKNKKFRDQISINIAKNHIHPYRAEIISSNFLKNIKNKYDYIFANPPYISKQRIQTVQKSVLRWEPHEALFASKKGLYYIQELIERTSAYVVPGGSVFIEFDPWQKKEIEKIINKDKTMHGEFWKDQYNRWRVISVTPIV